MYQLEYLSQFQKDFKKIAQLAIPDVIVVGHVITILQQGHKLAANYVEHSLTGNWANFRDCHVKPDLVLIYKIENNTLKLASIGAHSELFS
jgi:mRNA interferase YafQ